MVAEILIHLYTYGLTYDIAYLSSMPILLTAQSIRAGTAPHDGTTINMVRQLLERRLEVNEYSLMLITRTQ